MIEVVKDITAENLQFWVGRFYAEVALGIIEDSENLRLDWTDKIQPQFKAFFFSQDEVKERLWVQAFGDDERDNESRENTIDALYVYAEKMLYAKVKTHFGFAESRALKVLGIIYAPFASLGELVKRMKDPDGSTYQGEEYPETSPKNN